MSLLSLMYQGVFKRTSTFTAAVCVGAIGVGAPPPPPHLTSPHLTSSSSSSFPTLTVGGCGGTVTQS